MFTDQSIIEKQLSLEGMTPNQTTNIEDLLDRITLDQYHEFRDEVILETSVTALYYLRTYLEQRKADTIHSNSSVDEQRNTIGSVFSSTPSDLTPMSPPSTAEAEAISRHTK